MARRVVGQSLCGGDAASSTPRGGGVAARDTLWVGVLGFVVDTARDSSSEGKRRSELDS